VFQSPFFANALTLAAIAVLRIKVPLLIIFFLYFLIGANVSGLCVVALSRNLKLTTTLDRVITQNPCYVVVFFFIFFCGGYFFRLIFNELRYFNKIL